MPEIAPLGAAGSRLPKKPRPIPKAVRAAIQAMVYGREGDDECKPLDFIEAAKECGVKPDVMRRWFDYPHFVALLRAERKAFRTAICAGNEAALRRQRDTSRNGMVVVAAVRGLEQLDDHEAARPQGEHHSPGIVIRIVQPPAAPGEIGPGIRIIEHEPAPAPSDTDTEAQEAAHR
jgi:hypothetical protein